MNQCNELMDMVDLDRSYLNSFPHELSGGMRQRGVIAEVANAVAMADGNIERISVEDQNARFGIVSLVVHVNGRKHLARVMRRVRNIRAVTHIGRVRH